MENNQQYNNNYYGNSNEQGNYYNSDNYNNEQGNYYNSQNNNGYGYNYNNNQQVYGYNNQQPYNNYYPVQEVPQKASGVSVASLVCALVAFVFNPLSLLHIVAIILGIVGCATANGRPKGIAIAGIILGCVCIVWQGILDIVLAMFTFGLSFLF